jgi:hypothetical protein
MAVENEAKIWAVMGQSGTGKGIWIKAQLRKMKPRRILILDPQDEYHEFGDPVSAAEMARRVVQAGPDGPFRVRYVFPKTCTREHFANVFNLACQLTYAARNCIFLPEELSNFTTASHAPPLWKRMCNSGRHEGVHVIGASQFPAQIDKAFLSNATLLHVGYLKEEPHRKPVASAMDVKTDRIKELPDLHFLEWQRKGRKLFRGEVTISGRVKQREISPTGENVSKAPAAKGKKPA